MKKLNAFFIVMLLITVLISCEKEKIAPPSAFSAVGFWSGALASGPGVLDILNRPDGTARIYLRLSPDTALALLKIDGRFTVTEDHYEAQAHDSINTMKIQTLHTTTRSMEGVVFLSVSDNNTLTSFPFEVAKQ
jgi:hypothetical protein